MFVTPHSPPSSPPGVVPHPRRPLDPAGPGTSGRIRRWYENELGWPTVPGDPVRLVVGERFDVLDVPAEAGRAALRHLWPASPVALWEDRMLLLVAPGSAEELPGLLEWLEWGPLRPDLRALGPGGVLPAPLRAAGADARRPPGPGGLTGAPFPVAPHAAPEGRGAPRPASGSGPGRPLPLGRLGSQGAAVWLRPPEPGCEAEASLPTLSALGGGGDAPDLVRLVNTVATWCHRIRLRGAVARPPALPAQGR
ncbi:SCO3374 family protein [Streptomyces sp. NPDC058735]|uniref:SCO3374 family protein n=1 Tax=unclassified Streptomyces TaxID=2593676 RepID=UPI0036A9B237